MSGLFGSIIGAVEDYAPVIGAAGGLYDAYNQSQSRSDYADLVQRQEQEKYDAAAAERQNYLNYLDQYNAAAEQNRAASAAASRSAAAAANATQNAKLAAGKRGRKQLRKQHQKSLGYLNPFIEAGHNILPAHTQAAQTGLEGLGLLAAYLQSPEQMKKMDQSKPLLQHGLGLPLPEHMTGG